MNKNYFKYLMQSHKNINIFLLITNLILTTFNFLLSHPRPFNSVNALSISSALLLIEALTLPLLIFFYRFSKRASDTYFSLPLNRKELFITSIVYMAVVIVGIHIITILPILVNIALNFIDILSFILTALKYLVIVIAVVIATLLIASAIIFQANTLFDAIIIEIIYLLLPFLLATTVSTFGSNMIVGYEVQAYDIMTYFFLPTLFFNATANVFTYNANQIVASSDPNIYLFAGIIIIVGLIAGTIAYYDIVKHKVESTEQISNKFFAYPFLITFVAVCLISVTISSTLNFNEPMFANISETLMWILVVFVAYQIMCFVYRRNVRISKKSLIIFIIAIVFNYLLATAAYQTEGFGLSDAYLQENELEHIYFNFSFSNADNAAEYEDYNFNISNIDTVRDNTISEIKHIQTVLTRVSYHQNRQTIQDKTKTRNIYLNLQTNYAEHSYDYHSYKGNLNNALSQDDFTEIFDSLMKIIQDPSIKMECYMYVGDDYQETPLGLAEIKTAFDRIYFNE